MASRTNKRPKSRGLTHGQTFDAQIVSRFNQGRGGRHMPLRNEQIAGSQTTTPGAHTPMPPQLEGESLTQGSCAMGPVDGLPQLFD